MDPIVIVDNVIIDGHNRYEATKTMTLESSVVEIPIGKIIVPKRLPNQANFYSKTFIKQLAKDIKEHGLATPLNVQKNKNSTYTVIDGEARFHAAKEAGLETVPCIIVKSR